MADARILIVEDEGIEALDIQQRLIRLGYPSPQFALSGEEALEQATTMLPDLILMDINLGEAIDGVTIAEQIRSSLDVPIIYLTAYTDQETLRRAKITEPYGYIVKPFKEREVHITIDMALYRHRMERKLRESEKFFATTLRSIGDAVVATDRDGRITFMNAVAEQLTGWRLDESRGKKLPELFSLIGDTPDRPAETQLASKPPVLVGDMKLVNRAGAEIAVDASAAPVQDERGNVSGTILVLRDVTEKRALTRRLRRQNQDLEEQYRLVKNASRIKSEFIANMSHELRTPLNAAIGFSQLLYDGLLGPMSADQQEYLGDILTNSQHLLRLIDSILNFAQVESERIQFQPERVSLTGLLGEVQEMLQEFADAQGISVATSVAPEVDSVIVDAANLKQVLYNYLSNALKFTRQGGRVTMRAAPDDEERFRVEVEDTGIGVHPHNLGRLFVEFQQLDTSMSKQYQGVGMGLALTKRLVEAQGGCVGVRSTPEVGSTFFAVLPRVARRV